MCQVVHDLGQTEHTHGHHGKVDTVLQFGNAKVKTGHTRVHIGTHHTQQQAQNDHTDRFGQGTGGQYHGTDQTQYHQGEVFGGTELEGNFSQGGRKSGQQNRSETAGKERTQRRNGQRGTGTAVLGHLVPVQDGHHR